MDYLQHCHLPVCQVEGCEPGYHHVNLHGEEGEDQPALPAVVFHLVGKCTEVEVLLLPTVPHQCVVVVCVSLVT